MYLRENDKFFFLFKRYCILKFIRHNQTFINLETFMTIAVAWIRKDKDNKELFFCSDSRLCGGQRWDQCPKLSILPGEYSMLAFAGDTNFAYPMISSIKQALSNYPRIVKRRGMDVVHLSGTMCSIFNFMLNSVYDVADPDFKPDLEYLVGGYSPLKDDFKIYRLHYVPGSGMIEKNPSLTHISKNKDCCFVVIGDKKKEFKDALKKKIISKYGSNFYNKSFCFDYEPFEVICDMLRESTKEDTIGGPPQMVKCYKFMFAAPVGVYWPSRNQNDLYENRTMLGRTMMPKEVSDSIFIDPKTNETFTMDYRNTDLDNDSEELETKSRIKRKKTK